MTGLIQRATALTKICLKQKGTGRHPESLPMGGLG